VSVKSERKERVEARGAGRTWLKVTEADLAALEDYVSDVTSLGC